jgi:hypothetical protein
MGFMGYASFLDFNKYGIASARHSGRKMRHHDSFEN